MTVGGRRYHLDATFDNSLQRGVKRYDYFNLDDRHIFRDHEELVLPVPPCTEEKGYFYRPVSLTKVEDVENRAKQALRKKQAYFVFHWRGGGLNRAVLEDILTRCQAAGAGEGERRRVLHKPGAERDPAGLPGGAGHGDRRAAA